MSLTTLSRSFDVQSLDLNFCQAERMRAWSVLGFFLMCRVSLSSARNCAWMSTNCASLWITSTSWYIGRLCLRIFESRRLCHPSQSLFVRMDLSNMLHAAGECHGLRPSSNMAHRIRPMSNTAHLLIVIIVLYRDLLIDKCYMCSIVLTVCQRNVSYI